MQFARTGPNLSYVFTGHSFKGQSTKCDSYRKGLTTMDMTGPPGGIGQVNHLADSQKIYFDFFRPDRALLREWSESRKGEPARTGPFRKLIERFRDYSSELLNPRLRDEFARYYASTREPRHE